MFEYQSYFVPSQVAIDCHCLHAIIKSVHGLFLQF